MTGFCPCGRPLRPGYNTWCQACCALPRSAQGVPQWPRWGIAIMGRSVACVVGDIAPPNVASYRQRTWSTRAGAAAAARRRGAEWTVVPSPQD